MKWGYPLPPIKIRRIFETKQLAVYAISKILIPCGLKRKYTWNQQVVGQSPVCSSRKDSARHEAALLGFLLLLYMGCQAIAVKRALEVVSERV